METETGHISTTPPLDTLAIAKLLRKGGINTEQAEVHAEVFGRVIESNLATKTDIAFIQRDIADVRRDIEELRTELKRDMKELENRLTFKTGAIVAAIVGFFTVMDKFF